MGDIGERRKDKPKGENPAPSSNGHLPPRPQGSESVAPPPQTESTESSGGRLLEPSPDETCNNSETVARLLRIIENSNLTQQLQNSELKDAADPNPAPPGLEESSARAPADTRRITKGPSAGADPATAPPSPPPQVGKPTTPESSKPQQLEPENSSIPTAALKPPVESTPEPPVPLPQGPNEHQRYELVEDPPSRKSPPPSSPSIGSDTIDSTKDISPFQPPAPAEHLKPVFSRLNAQLRRLTSKTGKEFFQNLLAPRDPRRNPRLRNPPVVAFFWTGDLPKPHRIADISSGGLYMLTPERWSPGTRLSMKLRRTDRELESAGSSLAVDLVIVRSGSDGLGGEFMPCAPRRISIEEHTVDGGWATKRDLEQFVGHLIVSD